MFHAQEKEKKKITQKNLNPFFRSNAKQKHFELFAFRV